MLNSIHIALKAAGEAGIELTFIPIPGGVAVNAILPTEEGARRGFQHAVSWKEVEQGHFDTLAFNIRQMIDQLEEK